MSATQTATSLLAAVAPISRRVRAYFAPVNRATGQPTIFDAAQSGRFDLDAPPAPWIDLGWCSGFVRKAGSVVLPLRAGAPAVVQSQVRTETEATVHAEFQSWGKLQLALASGSQQMNLLAASPVSLATSGGASTATSLNVGASAAAGFSAGDLLAVDVDYGGQVGFVGSGSSGAWVRAVADVGGDVNFVRRMTLNVGRVISIAGGVLQLGAPLLAGAPVSGMQVSRLYGLWIARAGRSFRSGRDCSAWMESRGIACCISIRDCRRCRARTR